MAIAALSQADLANLEIGLRAMAPAGVTVAQVHLGDVQKEFCAIWPKAKPILVLVAKYIGVIPGVGATASAILNALIDGLDTLSGAIGCSSSAQTTSTQTG